jgi:hypothetical protein
VEVQVDQVRSCLLETKRGTSQQQGSGTKLERNKGRMALWLYTWDRRKEYFCLIITKQ